MFENLVFPGVETVYDYISYCKNNNDRCTYSSKDEVKVWDDVEQKFIKYHFSCGCTGMELHDQSGNNTTGFRMPFVKIDVKQNTLDSLYIDNDHYIFLLDKDKIDFLDFVKAYNAAIDRFIRDGINECFLLSSKLYNGGLAVPTQNFINMIPRQFFVELNVYKAMLRDISWRDSIFSNYANFNMDEIKEAYNLIHNKSNEKTFQQIQNLFNNFANVISEKISIPLALLKLTSFLLIRKGVIDLFSKQWQNNYDLPDIYNNAESYVAECVQKNLLSSSDSTAMTMLTYYLMSVNSTMRDDYYIVIPKIYSIVLRCENQKQQDNFKKQLFQTTHNNTTETYLNISDVDFLSGDEFEALVCKLFRRMGFQAYTTKHSGDQGIDVIAEKGTLKIGIQAKCYTSTVGNSAIQEAVAGKAFYGCNRVMVITNNTFTKAAEELASANNVVLWGRNILREKLVEYPVSL